MAKFKLHVDDTELGETTLGGEAPKEYRRVAEITQGPHVLAIEFTNDQWDPDQGIDRNLWINGVYLKRVK